MTKFELEKSMLIEELIDFVKMKADRDLYYSIYSYEGADFISGEQVFIDIPVQVDDNDNEIYPPEVLNRKLCLAYSGEQFQDVIDLAIKQKPTASSKEIIKALNYYSNHDDFLDLN